MNKLKYFKTNNKNKLLQKFTEKEIMIIGSLLEKEGLDLEDKRKISSVIFNRLKKKMKLQIDATVLYSITNGDYELDRKLLLSDLKFDHPSTIVIFFNILLGFEIIFFRSIIEVSFFIKNSP